VSRISLAISRTVTPLPRQSTVARSDKPSSSVIVRSGCPAPRTRHRVQQAPSAPEPPGLRAGGPGRPVVCAVPPGYLMPSAAPLVVPTGDSSHLPLSTPVLYRHGISPSRKRLRTTRVVLTGDSDLLHVSPADFKIRCSTHLMHSGMLGLLLRCAGVRDVTGTARPDAARQRW
jgi:hypothetical protein